MKKYPDTFPKRTHGMSKTPIYKLWHTMVWRCNNKENQNYGGRGIYVCERWRVFEHFYADMGNKPKSKSLDRIDNDGPYAPWNCRWATQKEQCRNTRRNKIISLNGVGKSVTEWAESIGLSQNTLLYRLRRGINPEDAITENYVPKHAVEAKSRQRPCDVCGTIFQPRLTQLRAGHGKFCSQKCNGINRKTLHALIERNILRVTK